MKMRRRCVCMYNVAVNWNLPFDFDEGHSGTSFSLSLSRYPMVYWKDEYQSRYSLHTTQKAERKYRTAVISLPSCSAVQCSGNAGSDGESQPFPFPSLSRTGTLRQRGTKRNGQRFSSMMIAGEIWLSLCSVLYEFLSTLLMCISAIVWHRCNKIQP